MPNIKDIELYVPKNRKLNWAFFQETRCMAFLYSRLLPKLNGKENKGIQVFCVESLVYKEQIDRFDSITFNYLPVFVEADVEAFLANTSEEEKKEHALEIVHRGMKLAAHELSWDLSVLEDIYYTIKDLKYENIYPLLKKSSPNKKYTCTILCHHEVKSIDVYLEVKKRNGGVIKKEKLFSVDNTYEQNLFSDYGSLKWILNHKVEFADKDYKTVYTLTFLEKDTPEDLVWRIDKTRK
ncbi:hypothetical protein AWM68_02365 [Fictibacillus phosphorivorans]|uniref:Uncharacterized protein n=1 Tax=Fictibacillus phosphorivorans TaxID=1221500 RepID=A0A161TRU6_9BACL|nr:hypothetical protein [Fictibacillus phosphorivorans]KZE69131.1 hypothetical protein AWM68_02365 [Fictibacillus phosphorivorans]